MIPCEGKTQLSVAPILANSLKRWNHCSPENVTALSQHKCRKPALCSCPTWVPFKARAAADGGGAAALAPPPDTWGKTYPDYK